MSRHYFKNVPNLRYKNNLSSNNSSANFLTVKNLFLRAKLRDDVSKSITFLQSYTIEEGARPDTVAEDLYGDPSLDWIVLTVANITNVRNEWPMSNRVLYKYCEEKYGNDLNATQFYETREVKNGDGKLILPAGLIVDRDFTIRDPDTHNVTLSVDSPNPLVIGINNYLSETRENEKKRNIKIMREEYLTTFLLDMRDTLKYTKSSQYQSPDLKIAK
tara:strand:- start:772 stop:1422 length:651 start_codon:yes stop_codon:yes gene_type:complete